MDDYTKIKQILRKHEYEVILYATTISNFLTVFIPKRKDYPKISDGLSISYLYDEMVFGNGIIVDVQQSQSPTFLYSPRYAISEITISDIFNACEKINYDTNLASFYIDSREVDKSEFRKKFFNISLSKKEERLKKGIESVISIAEESGFNEETDQLAIKEGVEEAYSIIKEIYLSEV
jgi:hypothetical protein